MSYRFEIKTSTIEGAGRGLFAKIQIKPGDNIGEFAGLRLSEQELENSEYVDSDNLLWVCNDLYIVCEEPYANHTRFVNHHDEPNCEIVTSNRWKTARIRATRSIQPGEELFIDYGPEYWEED